MVNINTINKLERLGIGPNIDKLEYHATLLKYAEQIGFDIFDNKEDIEKLLNELKPSVNAVKSNFSTNDNIIASLDEVDCLFMPGGYIGYKIITEKDKSSISKFNSYIDIKGSDIFSYALPLGIKIRVIYKYGKLERACIFNQGDKGKDITYIIKSIMANNIKELASIDYIELKCIITNTLRKDIDNIELLKLILDESRYDISDFKIYIYDIRINNIELNEKTYLNIFEQYTQYNFNIDSRNNVEVITVAIINNIRAEEISDAINQLKEYFRELKEFNIKELIITLNSNRDEDIYLCIDLKNEIDAEVIYESTVNNIKWIQKEEYCYPKIIINPVKLNNGNIVDNLELVNLKQLRDKNIGISSKIQFRVNENNKCIIV